MEVVVDVTVTAVDEVGVVDSGIVVEVVVVILVLVVADAVVVVVVAVVEAQDASSNETAIKEPKHPTISLLFIYYLHFD